MNEHNHISIVFFSMGSKYMNMVGLIANKVSKTDLVLPTLYKIKALGLLLYHDMHWL